MVCNSSFRFVILQAGHIERFTWGRVQLSNLGRSLNATWAQTYSKGHKFTKRGEMMVDSGATAKGGPTVDILREKDDDRSYASGGWKSEDRRLSCGYSSFRGKRASMEDFFDVKTSKINGQTVCMFGIFDGHGGSRAAEFLKEHLFENLMKHPQFLTNTKLAISETYQQTDMDFLESEKDTFRDDGSTASAAVLVGNHLYVANVGDSRTVISKAGKAIPLSEDHKPNRSDERKRIESAGGVIMWAGTWRVGGVLAMSRAFGNRMLKQFVVAEPEIQDQEIDAEFELLVLASDGLWDVVPNEDAVSIARTEEEPEAAAQKLTEAAFSRGSADNITCIVVKFHHEKADPTPFQPSQSRSQPSQFPSPSPCQPQTSTSQSQPHQPEPEPEPEPQPQHQHQHQTLTSQSQPETETSQSQPQPQPQPQPLHQHQTLTSQSQPETETSQSQSQPQPQKQNQPHHD